MKIRLALVAGLAGIVSAATAAATTLDFSYTSSDNGTASWTQSSTPIPGNYVNGFNTTVFVTNGTETAFSSTDSFTEVLFFPTSGSGGFLAGGSDEVGDNGAVIYSGTEASPVFSPGTYTLYDGSLTVTAEASGVPEPAAWSMMLLGVAGVGDGLRTRRDRRFAAA
jgi:hypothetical protein